MPPRVEGQLSDAIISSSEDGVIGVDRTGAIRMFNAAAAKIFGVVPEAVLGRIVWDVLPPGEFSRDFIAQIKENEPDPVQKVMLLTEDKLFSVRMTAVRSGRGRSLGAYAVMRDVSGVHKIERGLDEIFTGLTREISIPLTTIKGFVETLLDGAYIDDPMVTRKFLQIINGETNNLVRLVMSLDSVVHMDKEPPLNKTRFRIENLIESCTSTFAPIAESKQVDISCTFSGDLPWITADERLINRAFVNLLDNAVRYAAVKRAEARGEQENGKVDVSVEVRKREFYIKIQDNGIGISAEDKPHIFERFFRGSNPEAANLGGTGLGLSVAEGVVKAHGGHIEVESEPGRGACFTVVLPVRV